MTLRDAHGNAVGTTSSEALGASDQALWRMMSFYGTPVDDLDAAIAADPGWLLPRVMKAGFLLALTEPGLVAEGRAALAEAELHAASGTARERGHLAAVHRIAEGDWQAASDAWQTVLDANPRDALALQWALLFDFYRGDTQALLARVARALPEWHEDDPLFAYVLGLQAFGLEESGRYAEAETVGRRAVSGKARVPWAIHAVAHVMEMQGRHEEGRRWLEAWRPHWGEGNGFAGHLAWHEAVFCLESLDAEAALAPFDRYLNPQATEITLQRLDAASLLWRLRVLDFDVDRRARALLAGWQLDRSTAGVSAFNDVHGLLALLAADDIAGAETWQRVAFAGAKTSGPWNRAVMRDVGAPLMSGLLDFAHGRFDAAAGAIAGVRPASIRLGGSHAQRGFIEQTLLAASARGTDKAAGRTLLAERRGVRRRTPLVDRWARALDLPGGSI